MIDQQAFVVEHHQQSNLEDLRELHEKLRNVTSGSVFVNDVPRQSKLKSKSYLNLVRYDIKIQIHNFKITSITFLGIGTYQTHRTRSN